MRLKSSVESSIIDAMSIQIVESSKGPLVIYNGIVLHLSDQEGMCAAIDEHPQILSLLEESTANFFKIVAEYVLENFLAKRMPDTKIMKEAVESVDRFHKLAYSSYKNYIEGKVKMQYPNASPEELIHHVTSTNCQEINDFYMMSLG